MKYSVKAHKSDRCPATYLVVETDNDGKEWTLAECPYEKWADKIADALIELRIREHGM